MKKEAREGYKMTELGEIPEDWEIYSLEELLKNKYIIDHLDGNHGELYPRSNEFVEFGIPYIGANSIKNSRIDFNNVKYVTKERANKFKKGIAKNNDVLFAHNATVGPVALLNIDLDFVILSTTLTYYRCNTEKILPKYLLYYMQTSMFSKQYMRTMGQTTRNQVPITVQRSFKHIIPPMKEQEKIVSILSSVDEQIDNVDALIEKNKELKKGLMQTLLTKGIGHTKFKKTEIGEIPEEWEVVRLGEICDFKQGFQIPRSEQSLEWKEGYIRYLYITDFFSDNSKLFIRDSEKYYYIEPKDIAIANTGNTCGKAFRGATGVLSNNMFKIFNDKNRISDNYLWNYLNSDYYWNELSKYFNTAGQPHVGHKNMSQLKIIIPNKLSEQEKIASILSSVDEKIEEYESKKEKLEELKKGLMQQLLTGKIRVM